MFRAAVIIPALLILSSFSVMFEHPAPVYRFPYSQAGLTKQEAAAHLLSRFSFGATPGQVEEVVKTGIEKWFFQQLTGSLPDDSLNKMLSAYESLSMNNEQIAKAYPKNGQILKMAIADGIIDKETAKTDKQDYKKVLKAYAAENGYKPQSEMIRQLINQKILSAAYSQNQLREVLTDFWFNHFNVSLTKGDTRGFVSVYEREAIRKNVFGRFENLLLASAKSPAMLTYLDNFRNVAPGGSLNAQQQKRQERYLAQLEEKQAADSSMQKNDIAGKLIKAKRTQGLNENYGREIMELHTVGVDGGYTQTDVTNAARIFTGWTINPSLLKGVNK
ncbi:MAG: DUF1800 family protein, partial [Flavitalea sp.]